MKTFKLKKYERFEITGKGTVFTAHRDTNNIEGIKKGSFVVTEDDGKLYEVTGVEKMFKMFKDLKTGKPLEGKNVGILVKEHLSIEEICKLRGIEFHPLKDGEKHVVFQIIDRRRELIDEIGLYRLGRKQKRALLNKNGEEVALFSKKHKDEAQKVCTLLNLEVYRKIKEITDEEFKDIKG